MTQHGVNAPAQPTSLAGRLLVSPGAPLGSSLASSRPNWAPRLARGQAATALPGLMASLFNLCSHAHRLACQLALEAAAPGVMPAAQLLPHAVAQRLRHETALAHIRRMGLDWPRLLAGAADDPPRTDSHAAAASAAAAQAASLKACPLLRPVAGADPWPATLAWLEAHWLHTPADHWLAQWQQRGGDWLHAWSSEWSGRLALTQPGSVAALIDGVSGVSGVSGLGAAQGAQAHTFPAWRTPLRTARALPLPAEAALQQAVAQALATQPGFALLPQWQGACAHTGSWTRWREAPLPHAHTPWTLLGARLAELVRLCLPDGPGYGPAPALGQGSQWLAFGSASTGPGQALAWVEMARGVLMYRVALDAVSAPGGPLVAACEVLAPTEWNFHPLGEVAQRVSALDPSAPTAQAQHQVNLLMAAFDPCVPFELNASPRAAHPQEALHA